MDDDVNETPHVYWWTLAMWNLQSLAWAVDHWLLTHAHGLRFCHSCSGYFREQCMTLPDKCEACYARDYGIPFDALILRGGQSVTDLIRQDRDA